MSPSAFHLRSSSYGGAARSSSCGRREAQGDRSGALEAKLGVASRREVQCPQQARKAFRASTRPQIDRWFPSVYIVTLLLLITLMRFPALDASAWRHRCRSPDMGIVPMPAHNIHGRSWAGRLRWSFVGGFRHTHNWRWGDQVADIRDVQSVCLGQGIL